MTAPAHPVRCSTSHRIASAASSSANGVFWPIAIAPVTGAQASVASTPTDGASPNARAPTTPAAIAQPTIASA